MTDQTRLADILTVRAHPTVVRLDQLRAPAAQWISEAYVITPQIGLHLAALKHAFTQPQGRGVFVIGHYGSGKSHFLAYLAQQLSMAAWFQPSPQVVSVSLLNFRAVTSLETIIHQTLDLPRLDTQEDPDRRTDWATLATRYPNGLVLIIDELSEFLRAKPSPAAFNEDIRYLQYLAEWAQDHRFWIIAAMQEQIEHTGDLEYALYRKIKDRYSLRLLLTPTHVRDLISQAILCKQAGYDAAVAALTRTLQTVFPSPQIDYAALSTVYPLHPVTLDLLGEIRDRFSQTRGIVDFVTTVLAGDPTRNRLPFLHQPIGSLVTPDLIVDHFRDLFEIQPEFLPLAQHLFPYYERHLNDLFTTPAQRELAWRIVKTLIVAWLTPDRRGLTAADIALWLLLTAARIDPKKNTQIIDRVLQQLVSKGRYITCRDGLYTLDLADNSAVRMETLLAHELAELGSDDALVCETLVSALPSSGFHPFALPREQWQTRQLRWHFHERPYAVYLGHDAAPNQSGEIAIVIRLPWGTISPVPESFTIVPKPLTITTELRELAALWRIGQRPAGALPPDLHGRVTTRVRERLGLLSVALQTAYTEAVLFSPGGQRETIPRTDLPAQFDDWLTRLAEVFFKRRYPGFERCAPSYGPLPKEAYRRLMRWLGEHDIGAEDADEYVRLAREAYWVPMGLLRRKNREYIGPANVERNELLSLITPLIANEPNPSALYDHLAQPIYGLVPDQVHLLLIYLLIQGEIDIVKGKHSYREYYDTLPLPIQYDRIVTAHTLSLDKARELTQLCDGLHLRTPKQWTVLAQRQAVQQLRETGRQHRARLQPLLLKLTQSDTAPELRQRLQQTLGHWATLDKGENEVQGLQQFLFEIGSPARFLATLAELNDLPQRLDRLLSDVERYRHLLHHPAVAPAAQSLAIEMDALGSPPGLDTPDQVEHWLTQARGLYDRYKQNYREHHDAWWTRLRRDRPWNWQPPALAASRHLALGEALHTLDTSRRRLEQTHCRGLSSLDYQPVCVCGFNGQGVAAFEQGLDRFQTSRDQIETALRLFFQQDSVKAKLCGWENLGVGVSTGTLNYLAGSDPLPAIEDIGLLDQHLAGVELVKPISTHELTHLLSERVWDLPALETALTAWVKRQNAPRLRFENPRASTSREPLLLWCAEQCLRYALPLPTGLSLNDHAEISAGLRSEWITAAALDKLETLGFTDAALDRIAVGLIEAQIPLPTARSPSPLVAAIQELLIPTSAPTLSDWIGTVCCLYSAHSRLVRLSGKRWLSRLDDAANAALPQPVPTLVAALAQARDAQWLVIDALGVPLAAAVAASFPQLLPDWRVVNSGYALVGPRTTMHAWYDSLLGQGINRPIEKINVVDTLIHERNLPLTDLQPVVIAELKAACRALRPRLDASQPLFLFADHGFRLKLNGQGYTHGGDSTLERIVPTWRLEPLTPHHTSNEGD